MEEDKKSGSCFCKIIKIFCTLFIFFTALLVLSYYFATDTQHTDIPHSLAAIFETQKQTKFIKKLGKKSNKFSLVYGNQNDGLFQFLEHYADLQSRKNKFVVVRRYQNNIWDTALKVMRLSKTYIDDNMEIQEKGDSTQWIFIIKNGSIPIQEIQVIQNRRKKDRIIVGIENQQNLKGFTTLKYPSIQRKQLLKVIAKEYKITEQQANIICDFYQNFTSIMNTISTFKYSQNLKKDILTVHYEDLSQYSQDNLQVMSELCLNGVASLKQESSIETLQNAGLFIFENKCYWKLRQNILNYQLFTLQKCVKVIVSEEIVQAKQVAIIAQINEQNQQQDKKVSDKKDKKKKKKGKKNKKEKKDKKDKKSKKDKDEENQKEDKKKEKKKKDNKKSKKGKKNKKQKKQKKQIVEE